MSAMNPEFRPDPGTPIGPAPVSPFAPQDQHPSSGLLGPLLPGYHAPVQDTSRIDQFVPKPEDVEMSGFSQLPGNARSHPSMSQNFQSLGARDQPYAFQELFTAESLPGMGRPGGGGSKWGHEVDDVVFHSPLQTQAQSPFAGAVSYTHLTLPTIYSV